jgi:cell division transport system permease protein
MGVLWALADPVRSVAASYSSAFTLRGLSFGFAFGLLTTGVALGLVGSWVSVSRHLRAVEPG